MIKIVNALSIIAIFFFIVWIIYSINTSNSSANNTQSHLKPTTAQYKARTIVGKAIATDGDSIEIQNKRIRLNQIDAPELYQKCLDSNYYEYSCGIISKKFLQNILKNQKIICKYYKKDVYNRYLSNCLTQSGININHEMIKNGMAIIYNMKEAGIDLKNIEKLAKKQKIGIWQGAFLEPKQYRKKIKK